MDGNHDELMRAIGRMEGKIDGINSRLDTLNGRVGKHDDAISSLNTYRDTQKGQMTILAVVWGVIASVIVAVINHFIPK